MPLDYPDPITQKFLTECSNKANKQRTHWFLKHKEELIQKSQCTEKHKHYTSEQIEETRFGAGILALSNQHKVNARHRRSCALTGATDTAALNLFFMEAEEPAVMKPVDTYESSILYKEMAAGGGRRAYLNARKRKLPEDKYNDCLTCSNVYGWALRESSVRSSAPEYKRFASFFHDMARLSGVHPDPPHYNTLAVSYDTCPVSE